MALFTDMTIKRKLTLIIMLISSAALLFACVSFIVYDRITVKDTMAQRLTILAEVIGNNSTAALTFDNRTDAQETLSALKAEPHVVAATIYSNEGVFVTYLRDGYEGAFTPPPPREDGHAFADGYLDLYRRIMLQDEPIGTVYVRSDLQELRSRLRRYIGIVLIFMFCSSLVAFFLSSWMQKIISDPILHLADVARIVSGKKDYSVRATRRSDDELGFLVEQFNEMLGQIQEREVALQKAHDELELRAQELQGELVERKRAEEERRRLESQIQHAQKLESLGILAGGIAHDFNNLLTGMLGHAALALQKVTLDSPAAQSIRQVELAAQRAADLTRQMLAYSGKAQFLVEVLNLSALVEEMAHLLQTVISKKAILRFRFAREIPLVDADPGQIRQIVMNLITNASDALGDEKGYITLRTGVVEADRGYLAESVLNDELVVGTYVYLEVSDTGCGMDADTQKRIFDPFFSTKFPGRGLGLAAVLGIVRGHRGAVKLYSEPGVGTTFRVLFPVSQGQGGSRTEDVMKAEQPWTGEGLVLVVDDEEYVRLLAKTILEEAGFTVKMAANGREGIELYQENAGEVLAVLLDMTMPIMNGAETFQELKKLDPGARVIVSSGHSEQDTLRQFAGAGVSGFVQKPYQPRVLLKTLREVMQTS